jgi:hypothetical protein
LAAERVADIVGGHVYEVSGELLQVYLFPIGISPFYGNTIGLIVSIEILFLCFLSFEAKS